MNKILTILLTLFIFSVSCSKDNSDSSLPVTYTFIKAGDKDGSFGYTRPQNDLTYESFISLGDVEVKDTVMNLNQIRLWMKGDREELAKSTIKLSINGKIAKEVSGDGMYPEFYLYYTIEEKDFK